MTASTKERPAAKPGAKKATTPKPAVKQRAQIVYDDRARLPYQIEKACSRDESRPILCNPWLAYQSGGVFLCATNSYIAVRIPITLIDGKGNLLGETTGPRPGPIPVDAFKAARKERTPLMLDDGHAYVGGTSWVRVEGTTPDLEKFVDPIMDNLEHFSISVSSKYLADTAAALGTDEITFRWVQGAIEQGQTLRPIFLSQGTGRDTSRAFGILMPIRIAGE